MRSPWFRAEPEILNLPACLQNRSSLPSALLAPLFPLSAQGPFGVPSQCRVAFLGQARRKRCRARSHFLGGVLSWISDAQFRHKAGSMYEGGFRGWGGSSLVRCQLAQRIVSLPFSGVSDVASGHACLLWCPIP